jgi:hypothetical protein
VTVPDQLPSPGAEQSNEEGTNDAEVVGRGSFSQPREVAPPPENRRKPTGLKITAGGMLLWGGTIAIGLSTVVLLAVLSRHLHHEGFAGLSTLFGLFFVASLIPSGVPLRAAALAVDGAPPMRMTLLHTSLMTAGAAAISPLVAYLLHLPVLAVLFVALQVVIAIPLAIRRGSLIAANRFDAMGANLFAESAARVVLGVIVGLVWGLNGVAAGTAAATGIALLIVAVEQPSSVRSMRQTTSLFDTWLSLVLLGLFVQLDILIAPSIMNHSAATRYDLAAVPSKGVYLVLVAVSTLIFPYVRVHASRRAIVVAAAMTFGIGMIVTVVLVALRPVIAAVLGQRVASLPLLLALGLAMSIAGATGILVNGGIALGVRRPWPPLLLGMVCLLVAWPVADSPIAFGVLVLCAEAGTLLITAWVCLHKSSSPDVRLTTG